MKQIYVTKRKCLSIDLTKQGIFQTKYSSCLAADCMNKKC